MNIVRYEAGSGILSIVFREATVFMRHLSGGVSIAYDKDGRLIGIEVADAVQRLGAEALRAIIPEGAFPSPPSVREKPPSEYDRSPMLILSEPIPRTALIEMAKDNYDGLIKAVVDIEKGMIALNADLHSDEESALLALGSRQEDLWGINIRPDRPWPERIEFDSMINVRPSLGNRTRGVDDPGLRRRILDIAARMIAE